MEFLANVASLYYEEGLKQEEIATQLGYSRSAISRFLTSAHEEGVVEIRIRHPSNRERELERILVERFPLDEALVMVRGSLDDDESLGHVGTLAAGTLESFLKDGVHIGVSWGTAVYEVADSLRSIYTPGSCVIQLLGAFGTPDPRIDGGELARTIARKLGGSYRLLPAPALVDSPQVREALLNDRPIREILEIARRTEVAIVGIGTTDPRRSSFLRAGYLTASELESIVHQGAVGDVCGIHFDIYGRAHDFNITQRVVGISETELRGIPHTIGVAAGEVKAPAILGALRSGFIKVLVTDDAAASAIIDLESIRG